MIPALAIVAVAAVAAVAFLGKGNDATSERAGAPTKPSGRWRNIRRGKLPQNEGEAFGESGTFPIKVRAGKPRLEGRTVTVWLAWKFSRADGESVSGSVIFTFANARKLSSPTSTTLGSAENNAAQWVGDGWAEWSPIVVPKNGPQLGSVRLAARAMIDQAGFIAVEIVLPKNSEERFGDGYQGFGRDYPYKLQWATRFKAGIPGPATPPKEPPPPNAGGWQ